jgi:hypothetical protein
MTSTLVQAKTYSEENKRLLRGFYQRVHVFKRNLGPLSHREFDTVEGLYLRTQRDELADRLDVESDMWEEVAEPDIARFRRKHAILLRQTMFYEPVLEWAEQHVELLAK